MKKLLLIPVVLTTVFAIAQTKSSNSSISKNNAIQTKNNFGEIAYSINGKWTKEKSESIFNFKGEIIIKDNSVSGYFLWTIEKVDKNNYDYYRDKMTASATEFFTGNYDITTKKIYITGNNKTDLSNIIALDTYEINLLKNNEFSGKAKGNNNLWDGKINGVYKNIDIANSKANTKATQYSVKTHITNILSTGKSGNILGIIDIFQENLTFIKFSYPNGNFSINNTPDKTLFLYDNKTGKKYMARDYSNIPLNQTVSGKNSPHQFVIGFERIPNDLKEFEVYEGDNAKQARGSWWLSVSLNEAFFSKLDYYETDFTTLNPNINRTPASNTNISFVSDNSLVPMRKTFEKKNIEESLKNNQWNAMQFSEYKSYFEDVLGFNTKYMEYKGNFKNGIAMLRSTGSNDFVVEGDFIEGKLNGYGKVHIVKSSMTSKTDITLEGNFINNKLHGLGIASRDENYNNKEFKGFFYNGKFVVNHNVGDIDENGRLVILLNNKKCKFYPKIEEVRYGYGMFYSTYRAYGVDIAFDNSIFGSQSISNMVWTGSCINGFAEGYGMIKLVGTSSENFTNTEKNFENEVLYGSFKNGHYNNCKIFNFIDLATGLVTGENAKKWIVFENGAFVGEDLSDVARVNREYNQKIKIFENEQKSYSSNYELVVNKNSIASVYFSNPEYSSADISIQDGGNFVFGSDIDSKSYSTTVFDNKNKIINTYNNPHDDNEIHLSQYQLPGKVVISYKIYGEVRKVELKVKRGGSYTVTIK